MSDSPASPISGIVNFRDLGGHATPDGPVRTGRVFRSDSLAHVDAADVEHLVEERGVRTVVDLRGATEVDAYPNHPMRDAGATIHHVPLIDPAKRERKDEQRGHDERKSKTRIPLQHGRPPSPRPRDCLSDWRPGHHPDGGSRCLRASRC